MCPTKLVQCRMTRNLIQFEICLIGGPIKVIWRSTGNLGFQWNHVLFTLRTTYWSFLKLTRGNNLIYVSGRILNFMSCWFINLLIHCYFLNIHSDDLKHRRMPKAMQEVDITAYEISFELIAERSTVTRPFHLFSGCRYLTIHLLL